MYLITKPETVSFALKNNLFVDIYIYILMNRKYTLYFQNKKLYFIKF